MSPIKVALFVFLTCLVASLRADSGDGDLNKQMEKTCKYHKDNGRCDNPTIKKQCHAHCGGGDYEETTEAPTKTTKSSKKTTKSGKSTTPKKKKNCDGRSPCVPLEEANASFRKRCAKTALSPECQEKCRYDLDTATLKQSFMKGPCNLDWLRPYLIAASNGKDQTGCCEDTGVLSQKKTGICGCFCNPTGPVWPTKGEALKYAPCVNVLELIMKCHSYQEGM